ncbi:uncharacterized protein [Palaemon carinicauda]|uniref:uncharacterized protein n=1 Tax=Palaemon carinicauda TaxID=392227 RepID=UPI0035B62E99
MFQRALILVAISAAFASEIPPPTTYQTITYELQTALRPEDPYTFPIIIEFSYTRDHIIFLFDFHNLIFAGFSNVNCTYLHESFDNLTTLNLEGHELEFNSNNAYIHINTNDPQATDFSSQLRFYTLDLRFKIDSYTPYPFSLCITRDTLQITFYAEGIRTYTRFPQVDQELNDHPKEVVEAINRYLPRLANNFTTALNNILCPTSR